MEGEGDFEVTTETELEAGFSLNLALEWRMSRSWGLEFGLLFADADLEIRRQERIVGVPDAPAVVRRGQVDLFGLTVSPLYHLTPTGRTDLFAGPLFSQTLFQDGAATRDAPLEDDLALGVQIGLSWPRGENRWMLDTRLRYLQVDPGLEASRSSSTGRP